MRIREGVMGINLKLEKITDYTEDLGKDGIIIL
jgi:hypothetical protein